MRRGLLALGVLAVALLAGSARDNPFPGQTPTDPQQLARIKAARGRLATALRGGEPAAIATAEAEVRQALGPYAGVPEAAEKLNPRGTKAPRPSPADYRKLTERMSTLASGSDRAKANRMELRNAAYLAIGLLAMVEADLPDASAYRKQAATELDFLVARQAPEGFFPYPADPVAPPHLQAAAKQFAREHPEKVRNGFIYADEDGAQFDTGCAAYALGYGYQVLKQDRFLKAARKAGDWALRFPLSPNWNYNSFSVWHLAKLAEVTGERQYRDGAVRLATLGVLPGQMENGRWSDQHNARAVYHWIMVRGLTALVRVLPEGDPQAKAIRDKTRLAVEARVNDVLRDGGSNDDQAYVALADALEVLGPNEQWERALAEVGGTNPYSSGIYARRKAAYK